MTRRVRGLAGLQLVEGVAHDRVARQKLVEGGIGLDREVRPPGLRFEPGIGIDDAQGILVGVVGGLEPALRFRLIADEVGDQPGMEVAESVVGALALQLVHHFERALSVIGTGIGPSGQEGAGEIGCSTPSAAGEVLAGLRELAGLDLANPKAELREAVRSIAGGEALGRAEGVWQCSVREKRHEGALEQFRIARVRFHGLAVEAGGGGGVLGRAGDIGGQEVALQRLRRLVLRHRSRFPGLGGQGRDRRRHGGGEAQGESREGPAGRGVSVHGHQSRL